MQRKATSRTPNYEAQSSSSGFSNHSGVHLVFIFLLAAFSLVGLRLVQLQVDPDMRFSEEDLRHIGQEEIRIPRGDISDRNGRILATDRTVKSLYANPSRILEPERVADFLCARLGLTRDEALERLARTDDDGTKKRFVWVKRWLTDDEYKSLEDLVSAPEGQGLGLKNENLRYYPEQQLAAHILGFANREGVGAEGIELTCDKYLRSVAGKRVSRVDAQRNFLAPLTLEYVPPSGGNDVYLTLDSTIQYTLEQELDKALERTISPRGMGIVLNPKTGAILALACRPAFNPNEYWNVPPEAYKNRALVDVFEPGSSFKIVTASGALEQGLITPDTLIDCENGSFNPYGHRIKDYHKLGVEPFRTCFAESSNIAMIKVGAMLGPERLEAWITRFGFGQATSPDFRGESVGIFRPRTQWTKHSMGSLPMGQEIAVTMPQLARAFCVIANGGYLIEPYLVERVLSPEGAVVYAHEPTTKSRVLSDETAQTMRELCHLVVTEGTGKPAAIKEYRVGGKTGTAQVALENGRGYAEGKYTTVFAGFAPVSDPEICAVIVIHEPQIKLHYGSYCCGPVFSVVARDALIAMSAPEDPMIDEIDKTMMADLVDTEDADTVAAHAVLTGPKDILDDMPEELDGLELVSHSTDTMSAAPRLPDFHGMTKREVRERLAALGLPWDPQGAGRVIQQEPSPGTPLEDVAICHLVFATQQPQPPAPQDHDVKRTHTTSRS